MPKVLTVAARESFESVLRKYKKSSASSPDDLAHLQRWINDPRTEEVWESVRSNNALLPPETFIIDILGARRVAIAIGQRGKLRKRYRNAADEMERVAKFLRKPHPYGMPSYPRSSELARMLDDAASYFRKEVEPSRNMPGVLKFSRKAQPHTIFMSMVSNDLKGKTGPWLDEEVAVLAEIAFDLPDAIDPEAVRRARRKCPGRKKA